MGFHGPLKKTGREWLPDGAFCFVHACCSFCVTDSPEGTNESRHRCKTEALHAMTSPRPSHADANATRMETKSAKGRPAKVAGTLLCAVQSCERERGDEPSGEER